MLERLAARGPLLLCLDYDGTISELVSRPSMAVPVAGAVDAVKAIAAHRSRAAVAIVSGRPVTQLREMTGLGPAVMYAGVHGLEIALRDDTEVRTVADAARCVPELERMRLWLADNVPRDAGFEVEDKHLSVALHYRNADRPVAIALCRHFEEFVTANAPHLHVAHNKMVVEAIPAAASKGAALRALSGAVGEAFEPIYFGDDRTDEDAFAELGEGRGLGVLVGEARPSRAHFRVADPTAVAQLLKGLARAMEAA